LKVPDDTFEVLYLISKGDLRKAINFLQIFSQLNTDDISGLYQIAGYLQPDTFSEYTTELTQSNYTNSVEILKSDLHFSGRNFLYQLLDWVISNNTISKKNLPNILEGIAEIDFRLTEGSERGIQLESLTALICEVLKK